MRCWARRIAFARELEARGIGKGDKVLIWGENCAEWVVAFFGCLLRGAIVVPIDKIAAPDFASAYRATSRCQALCRLAAQSDSRRYVRFTWTRCASSSRTYDDSPVIPPPLDARRHRADRLHLRHHCRAARRRHLAWQHSGEPGAAGARDRQVPASYERIFHPLRFLNLLPLSHVFGQFLGIFLPQLLAATVIFQDTLNPSEVSPGHQERARLGRRRCAASDGVAEGQDRTRPGSGGKAAMVSATVRGRERRALS